MKPLKHILLTLSLALLVPAASAGTFSINAWTNDTSSGIVAGQTLWAYHFGNTNTATVNGVTVPGTGTNVNPSVAGQFSVAGVSFLFPSDFNSLTALGGSGSAVMASSFLYGGAPWQFNVQGLTTGQVYTVSIYGVGRESPPVTRASNFTNGTDHIYVDENSLGIGKGLRVDYTFTATATTNLTIVMPTNSSTFHTYALALRQSLMVTTTSNAGPGSLRQAVLDEATLPGTNTITFAPALSGATITLTNQIIFASDVTIDATSLSGGVTVSGGRATRIFVVNDARIVSLLGLTLTGGNGIGTGFNGSGGAISTAGTLALTRCRLSNNSAESGGAIDIFDGTVTLSQCTLSDNRALYFGGAINSGAALTLNHCTFTRNVCGSEGGAIATGGSGGLSLTHCTLSANAAGAGGGIQIFFDTVRLTNCVVAGNVAPGSGNDIFNWSGALVRGGANIIGDYQPFSSATDSGPAPISADPLLATLGNYGGPTQTMPPLPGSPANDAASVIAALSTDQRGSARVFGPAPDIGAVESGGLWVQNTNNIGLNSLREVVADSASVTNSKIILFTTNLSGATIPLTSEIALTNNVSVDASSLPGGITVSGGNATRIFSLFNTAASLNGLTLANGFMSGDGGGAILNFSSALTLMNCTLMSNSCSVLGGGAINNFQGNLTLTHCTLEGNFAPYGGAIDTQSSTAALTHCTLAQNRSTGQSALTGGGAIMNYGGSALTLISSVLASNIAASGNGPDLWMVDGTVAANNCLVGNGTNSTLVNGVKGNLVGTGGSPINALLAPLGNYGGSTQTMPPLPGSPAINAAGASGFPTDQRGYPRPVGLAADIGAVEGIYNAAGPGKITSITRLGNGSVQLSFTNLTDASFPVMATTNISQPTSNWTLVGFATETSAGTGLIQFTDTQALFNPQRFYRVKSP